MRRRQLLVAVPSALAVSTLPRISLGYEKAPFQIVEDDFIEHPVAGRVRRVQVEVGIPEYPGFEAQLRYVGGEPRPLRGDVAFIHDVVEQNGLTQCMWVDPEVPMAKPHTPDQRLTLMCSEVDYTVSTDPGIPHHYDGRPARDRCEWWTFHNGQVRAHVFVVPDSRGYHDVTNLEQYLPPTVIVYAGTPGYTDGNPNFTKTEYPILPLRR